MSMLLNFNRLPSAEEVKQRVNERFDKLYCWSADNKRTPYVCVVCDGFIVNKDDLVHLDVEHLKKAKEALEWKSHEDDRRKEEIELHFKVDKE